MNNLKSTSIWYNNIEVEDIICVLFCAWYSMVIFSKLWEKLSVCPKLLCLIKYSLYRQQLKIHKSHKSSFPSGLLSGNHMHKICEVCRLFYECWCSRIWAFEKIPIHQLEQLVLKSPKESLIKKSIYLYVFKDGSNHNDMIKICTHTWWSWVHSILSPFTWKWLMFLRHRIIPRHFQSDVNNEFFRIFESTTVWSDCKVLENVDNDLKIIYSRS